jgi:bifunctional DNA-binding transcriptional regulator/antitoxin component of YhaV-PrlF toxin-antitoxin module
MLDTAQMQQIAEAHASISDKIRALDGAGVKRADIARFLNRRYQHVRNVLEGDKQRGRGAQASLERKVTTYQMLGCNATQPREVAERARLSASPVAFFRVGVESDGRLLLPRHVVEAFGASPGEVLIATASNGELVLRTSSVAVGRAQELVRALIPGDHSLADSLIAERRREVEEERRDG